MNMADDIGTVICFHLYVFAVYFMCLEEGKYLQVYLLYLSN